MNKLLLTLAAAALLASCAKNETFDSLSNDVNRDLNRISFQATTGSATRGAVNNLVTLEGLTDGFEVIGVSNFGQPGAASLLGENLANVNNYKYTSGAVQPWDWADATNKDWPTDLTKYPLQFFAAHPFPAGLTWDAATQTITPAAKVADQVDQLSAVAAVAAKPISGSAPLAFEHILSAIKFEVMSSPGYTVKIKELNIVNVTEDNEFNFSTGVWESFVADQTKSYPYFKSTNTTSTQTLTFAAPTAAALSVESGEFADEAIVDAGQMMLVPQTGAATNLAAFIAAAEAWVAGNKQGTFPDTAAETALKTGAYLQVTYNMQDADPKYIIGEAGKYVRVLFPLDLTAGWDMSKRYTYTLFLGTPDSSNGTVMDPDYKGEDGGNTGEDIKTPAVDPGKPVTKGKITFSVSVTDWVDEAGVDIK